MRRSGWFAVAIFVCAYAVSFLDRQVISLLVEPLKHSLAISDTQIGLLQGPAFGVCFALLGLPLGWLADRINRAHLIAAAIALWSAMTIASGLASHFNQLLVARIGVGVGEAALVPAAVSLLSELFPPARRALPLAIFTSGLSVGLGLALALGGSFIAYAQHGVATLPLLGAWLAQQQSWQTVFILAGMAGLPVAALVLLVKDPRSAANAAPLPARALTAAFSYLLQRRLLFLPLLAATTALYILSNAESSWAPSLFIRRFEWSATHTGATLGLAILCCALSGNLASGVLTTVLARRGHRDAPVRTMLIGACLMAPAAIIAPLLPSAALVLAGVLLTYLGIALTFGIATTAVVEVTPAPLRGQIVAIYLLLGNLLGLGLGPLTVGALVDHAAAPLNQLGPALSLVCGVVALPAIWLLLRARRVYPQAL
jgi:MFS family permease